MTTGNADIQAYRGSPGLVERWGAAWWLRPAVLALLLAWLFWPTVTTLAERWNGDPNWSHGWLVPVFSLYFLYTRRGELAAARTRTSLSGLVVLILSLAAYFYVWCIEPFTYFQALAMIGTIFGVVLFLAGWRIMRTAWLPILFLGLANPIPERHYFELTYPLRRIATELSQLPLGLIPGISLEVQGVMIDYSLAGVRGTLNVEEACAGMRLMMAFVTLGVAMAYLGDRPTWQRIGMVLACIPISIFCNLVRVTITGFLTIYGSKLATGTPHALLGLAMLPIALGLFALTGYVLRHLLVEVAGPDDRAEEGAQRSVPI